MTIRDSIAAGFLRWTDLVLRHRRLVVVAHVLVLAVLAVGLPRLRLETSFERYLPEQNPTRARFETFRREFGSGERIVVLLEPTELYDPGFLGELQRLHAALEDEIPYVDRLTSLVNARHLAGTAGSLSSVPLLGREPVDEERIALLRERVRANPLYRNLIVSDDERATAIVIELDGSVGSASPSVDEALLEGFEPSGSPGASPPRGAMLTTAQSDEVVGALERVLAAHSPTAAKTYAAGTPLIAHRLGVLLTRDIARFVAVSLVLTALLLLVLFGSAWATVSPLLVVGFAVVGTLGWMGLAGVPITAVTEVLPSLLLAIGVADSIHVQSLFFRHRDAGLDVEASIRLALEESGIAIFLTSLTTAASLVSFRVAELEPVIDLGRAAPIGVALAFLSTVTLLPVLLAWRPPGARGRRWRTALGSRRIEPALVALARVGTHRPRVTLAATAGVMAIAALGATGLRFSQDDLRWLPEDEPLRIATEALNRSMHGMEPLEVLLRIDGDDLDLQSPALIDSLREIERRARDVSAGPVTAAQTVSLADVLDETHRAIVDPGDHSPSPDTREAISQELLLFESAAPDDLARLVDGGWTTTRLAVTVPFVDALYYPRYARRVLDVANDALARRRLHDRVRVDATGLLVVAGETFDLLLVSMARSYALAFGVIGLLMLLLVGSIRLGLTGIVPNVAPILIVLGWMDWLDSPLDISSMLVGGILIGIVVDDTIHVLHHFARERAVSGCSLCAVRAAIETSGRAMLFTSLVLAVGFFSFMAATLSNVADFGLYCGVGVLLALVADLVVLPAGIALIAPCPPDCACGGRIGPADPLP